RPPAAADDRRMEIQVRDVPSEGRFEARDADGALLGIAAYYLEPGEPGLLVFTHTEVEEAAEGNGVGSRLAHDALEHARAAGQQIVALCPFVRAYLARHPEYRDLVRPAG
ncbi:MAG TPA: GNAT family N-acetyltransferase, partial [Cellulomonas sp.]